MRKTTLLLTAALLLTGLMVAAGLIAGTTVDPVIRMQNPAYDTHTKGIVEFTHEKHVTEYGAACGDCHHDDQGQPLTELKMGDEVQNCIECHAKPGQMPREEKKAMRDDKVPRAEQQIRKRAYHAEALHDNCRDCHRQYNKDNKTRSAPTTCSKCHPRD